MFKNAGDNLHFLERAGSHSTKGSRRGAVALPDEYMTPGAVAERTNELIRRAAAANRIAATLGQAYAAKDYRTIRKLRAILKAERKEIRELRQSLPTRIILRTPAQLERRAAMAAKYGRSA